VLELWERQNGILGIVQFKSKDIQLGTNQDWV
jgi:hypothetical protein